MTKPSVYALLLSAPLCLAACKKDVGLVEPEPPQKAQTTPAAEEATEPSVAHVETKLVELCDLPGAKFGFDSAALTDEDVAVLDALATCFKTGPAASYGLQLVGHADPRGTDEYNLALGQRRADSVAQHLRQRGLEEKRVETSSRGKLDADGVDEATWAADRRVDILLAGEE